MNLPENEITQFPSGRWGFVGRVSAQLGYVRNDGSGATAEELQNAVSFGPRLAGLKTRAWGTREEAEAAREALNGR
jgi:hypothetical protein